jgi:hypothetical protein
MSDSIERPRRIDLVTERAEGAAAVVHFATVNPVKLAQMQKNLAQTGYREYPSVALAPSLDERLINHITAMPHVIAAVKAGSGPSDYSMLLGRAAGSRAIDAFPGRVRLITVATDVMLLTPVNNGHAYPVYLGHNKPPEDAGKADIESYILTYFSNGYGYADAAVRPDSEAGFRIGAACCITDLVNVGNGFRPVKKRGLGGYLDVPFTYAPFSAQEVKTYVANTPLELLSGASGGCRWESRDFWLHLRSVDHVPYGNGFDRDMFLTVTKGGFPGMGGLIREAEVFMDENATGALNDQIQTVRRTLNGSAPQDLDLGAWGSYSGSYDVFGI